MAVAEAAAEVLLLLSMRLRPGKADPTQAATWAAQPAWFPETWRARRRVSLECLQVISGVGYSVSRCSGEITYTVARGTALVVVGLALLALGLVGGTLGLVGTGGAAALVTEGAAVGDLGHVDLSVGDGREGRGNKEELHLGGINLVGLKRLNRYRSWNELQVED